MLSETMLSILVCPKCKGDLRYEQANSELVCENCNLAYPIVDDIPNMCIDQAIHLNTIDAQPGQSDDQSPTEAP
ncbi:MAG: Trm112 family protein [Calditrichaeota bacterium]|nr:Trm112 family protein [Calditrichota bacterium]MCB0267956.1 Trm112 family protein [Calditrichota bacterium]MCB0286819.1 Trm112 family protein [Calditrichota bacterium]MCB0301234.1 Trm112 family protein [Calditrichota bacterium]MCB9070261.1 Trm112 family protein [Calditrichia bacterium]